MFERFGAERRSLEEVVSHDREAEEMLALRDALAALAQGRTPDNFDDLPQEIAPVVRALGTSLGQRDEGVLAETVHYSIQASEAMTATARITGEIRETDARAQSMAAAVEELTASIEQIATAAQDAAGSMETVSGGMRSGAEATQGTAQASRQIGEAFHRMTESADHLATAAEQIGTFVATVDGLAKQTNLLALNATIEAARAGEAGKGFAVVASEVKVLSGQTQQATDDIRARIERLSEHVQEVQDTVHEVQSLVERSVTQSEDAAGQISEVLDDVAANGTRMTEIASVLAQQSEAVQEISEGAQHIAEHSGQASTFSRAAIEAVARSEETISQQFSELEARDIPHYVLHRAKADHILWKKRLTEMLVGLRAPGAGELVDHRQCALGKWYERVEDARIRRHPAFEALLPAHKAVHSLGREAARLYEKGDHAGAVKAVEEMSAASQEVLRHLDTLIAVIDG